VTADPTAAPPEPAAAPNDISAMLERLNLTFAELERGMAGYNTLNRVFHTLNGSLPAGQRAKGLLLTFKGSIDDTHVLDVTVDIQKHVDPQHAAHVIVPLAQGQAALMMASVERLLSEATDLRNFLRSVTGWKESQPAPG
jgi:hypothetical protein